jgi:hypothetical protein
LLLDPHNPAVRLGDFHIRPSEDLKVPGGLQAVKGFDDMVSQLGPHLVEKALVIEGLPGGANVGLAQRNLLADVALAIARELALLVPVRVLCFQPPLALALSPPLLSAAVA